MNDFLRTSSQICDNNDRDAIPQIYDDKMDVDNKPEEYDVFPDLAFLESINPQHSDYHFSMGDDQFCTPAEFSEHDMIDLDQMTELRALLLETFPDGMPNEIDYESILADQHIPSDPSSWNYFELEEGSEYTLDGQ